MIDGIGEGILHSNFLLYADDLKLYRNINIPDDCILLQNDLTAVFSWLNKHKLTLHPMKCEAMSITNCKNEIFFDYKLGDHVLKKVINKKDLGVTFQKNLSFNNHIETITNNAFKALGMVKRFSKPFQNIDAIRTLYTSLVRSKLEYATVIWRPNTQEGTRKVERVQSQFVKYLFWKENGFYPSYPTPIASSTLCEVLDLKSLQARRDICLLTLIYNIINNIIQCPNVTEQISLKVPNMTLRSRADQDFFYIDTKTKNIYLHSTIPSGLALFNRHSQVLDLAMLPERYKEACASIL